MVISKKSINFGSYSAWYTVEIIFAYIKTRLFYRPARIIKNGTCIRGLKNIKFGKGFTCGRYNRIDAYSLLGDKRKTLIFGENVEINDRCHIASMYEINIGNNVLIASNVYITDHDHGNDSRLNGNEIFEALPVKINNNVWIGENVVILKGVEIGANSVIGASAVVTKSVPANCIAVGNPARCIKI